MIFLKSKKKKMIKPIKIISDGTPSEHYGSVKVSGFPFMLQGFNGVYEPVYRRTFEPVFDCSGCRGLNTQKKIEDYLFQESEVIFYLKPYHLYGLISILPVILYKWNGVWRFLRLVDLLKAMCITQITKPFDNPFLASRVEPLKEGVFSEEFFGSYRNPHGLYTVSVYPEGLYC